MCKNKRERMAHGGEGRGCFRTNKSVRFGLSEGSDALSLPKCETQSE